MTNPHRLMIVFSLVTLVLWMQSSDPTPSASTIGTVIEVATTPLPQTWPDIAYDNLNNRYLVVYSEENSGDSEILGRLYGGDGSPMGDPFHISAHPELSDSQPAVAFMAQSREYLVVWRSETTVGTHDIYAQRIASTGRLLDQPLAITANPVDQAEPDIAADPSGTAGYFVVWKEVGAGGCLGRRVRRDGRLDGLPVLLFPSALSAPTVAFGGSNANYFLAASTDPQGRVRVRAVRPGMAPDRLLQVNRQQAAETDVALAFHQSFGRWLVVWIGSQGNQIRGRFLDTAPNELPPVDVVVVPPTVLPGFIRNVDIAPGTDSTPEPRFIAVFDRSGELYAVPLNGSAVVGPQEPLFLDGTDNDRSPSVVFGSGQSEFLTVWHHVITSGDILGRRHRLP